MESSESSTADICTKLESKLDLQDISNSVLGYQDLEGFRELQPIPNPVCTNFDHIDTNNLHSSQSPQFHEVDEVNMQLDSMSPTYDPNAEFEAEDQYSSSENHLLEEEVYEDSTSSFYCSSSNSKSQSIESNAINANAREGQMADKKTKTKSSKFHEHTIFLAKYLAISREIPPKKEYIREGLIRSHKKFLRCTKENKPLSRVIKNLDIRSQKVREAVKRLKIHFDRNQEILKEVSKTEAGPKTDGSKKNRNPSHKSWNNQFIKKYFERTAVLESFLLYVDLIFIECDITTLIQRIKVRCCKNQAHPNGCYIKWDEMRKFISEDIITDLGLRVPILVGSQNALANVEATPGEAQGFGNGVLDSFLESNQIN